MSESLGTAVLELTTDEKGLTRGLESAKSHTSKAFSVLGTAAKVLAVGGIAGLGFAVKDVVGDFLAGQRGAAQTAAVIKSTGGSAGVTAKQVDSLATSIRNKTGIDDDQVTAGENMLLTFTNIHNAAGKNNDIFTQSTHILADLSTATGNDMAKSAVQLGKALNDPVKGVTALTKVGVTFSDQQKKQIAAMVKAGNVAGAQKVILGELRKEFGGSAEAAGTTMSGKLAILKGKLEDIGDAIVGKVMPYVLQFTGWILDTAVPFISKWGAIIAAVLVPAIERAVAIVKEYLPLLESWSSKILGVLIPAISGLVGFVQTLIGFLQSHEGLMHAVEAGILAGAAAFVIITAAAKAYAVVQALINLLMDANPIGLVVLAIAALAGGLYYAYQNSETFRNAVNAAFTLLKSVAKTALDWITQTGLPALKAGFNAVWPVVQMVVGQITGAIKGFIGWLRTNWDTIKAIFAPVIKTAIGLAKVELDTALGLIKGVINTFGDILHGRWSKIWGDLEGLAKTALQAPILAIKTIITNLGPALLNLAHIAVSFIPKGLAMVAGAIASWGSDVKGWVKGALADAGVWLFQAGRDLINGIINGLESKAKDLLGVAGALAHKVKKAFTDPLSIFSPSRVFYNYGQNIVEGLVNGIKDNTARAAQAAKVMAGNAITAAQNIVKTRAALLGTDLSRAFSQRQSMVQTPAEQALQSLQNEHDDAGRQSSLDDAAAALKKAQDAKDTGPASVDASGTALTPEDIANQQAQLDQAVLDAQKQLEDAKYNIKVAALQTTAQTERVALDASQTIQQQAFDAQLVALQTYLASSEATAAGSKTRITGFMNEWGISVADIGSMLGKGFQSGIESTEASTIKSVQALAKAIKKALKTGLEIHSPSRWTRDQIGRPLVQGIVQGINQEAITVTRAVQAIIPKPDLSMGLTTADNTPSKGPVTVNQTFNQTPANADPAAIGSVTSWALRGVAGA